MKCSWVKCSESLSNRVPNIIRRYIVHMKFSAYMAFPFITFHQVLLVPFFHLCIYGCILFIFLFNLVYYVFIAIFMRSYCYV